MEIISQFITRGCYTNFHKGFARLEDPSIVPLVDFGYQIQEYSLFATDYKNLYINELQQGMHLVPYKKIIANFVNDQLHGVCYTFKETDNTLSFHISAIDNYCNNRLHGMRYAYHGKILIYEANYYYGLRHGIEKRWDVFGDLIHTCIYEMGRCIDNR